MEKLYVDFDNNVPRYATTSCYHCTSLTGYSLCKFKNRGCCWYFPKFTLYDIHRMVGSIDGLQTLDHIRKLPNSIVYQYYIHAKGFFDKIGYDNYLNSGELLVDDKNKDHTTFFRACPFVKENCGCSLPPRFRSYICNFFICDELIEGLNKNPLFKHYANQRSSYSKWLQWENASLEKLLSENNLNLLNNFDGVIKLLQDIPVNYYDFPSLPLLEYDSGLHRGA